MGKRVHPVVVVLVLLVAIVMVALVYARRTETPKPVAASGMGSPGPAGMAQMQAGRRGGGGGGRGGRMGGAGGGEAAGGRADTTLGLQFSRSQAPQGFKVEKFEGTPNPSPLRIMGVKEGDVITAINGKKQQIRDAIIAAIKDLQEKGTPIELAVSRSGKTETIKWTQKLPAASVVEKHEISGAGGGARSGGPGSERGGRRGR